MARPITKKLSATTTEDSLLLGTGVSSFLIENDGSDDVFIDFDTAISADSFLLKPGKGLIIDHQFVRLYYKADTGTATLYTIKLIT